MRVWIQDHGSESDMAVNSAAHSCNVCAPVVEVHCVAFCSPFAKL